jgi:ribosomal protein L11 methyltransferase
MLTSTPRYPYVAVDVGESEADDAGALLFELGAQGVEQRDATTLARGAAGRVTLVASFATHDEARAAIAHLREEWGAWDARLEEVVGDAWRDEWKKHFEPFAVCPGIVIRPPWRAYDRGPSERVIVLEPGRAFGTGLHETTSLVAEALSQRADRVRGARVLDVGCGSGILALIALELGAATVRAIDVDSEAVAVATENAQRNGRAKELRADGALVHEVRETFEVVLANIEAKTLIEIAPALTACVAEGGWLVLSGILGCGAAASQWGEVRAAYPGLHVEEVREKGEWLAAVLRA